MKRRVALPFPAMQMTNHNPYKYGLSGSPTSSSSSSTSSCEFKNSSCRHSSESSCDLNEEDSEASCFSESPHRSAASHDDGRICMFIALVAVGVYINSLHGDFVHDDIPAITLNKDVTGATPLLHVFRNDFWGTPMSDTHSHKSYRPLTTLSFRLNHALFGLHSIWFHATNVMLHAAACVLFTKVCTRIAGVRRNFAIFAGVLFAIHPIHTEAVSGIVGRADVLACIFFLVSLLLYHGQKGEPDSPSVFLSTIVGGLSILAKETGITVLLVNLLLDIYKNWPKLKRSIVDVRWTEETQRFVRRVSRVLLSLFVLLAVRLALLQGSLPRFSQQDNPAAFHPHFLTRLMTYCYLAAFNWGIILCPSTLSHDWQMGSIPLVTSLTDTRNFATLSALCAILLLSYRAIIDFEHRRHIPLVLGLLLLVVPFLPATNLLVTVGFVVAERVLYIPSMGCVLLVVYGAQNLWEFVPRSKCIIIIMSVLLLTAGCLKTLTRNKDWSSREALLRSGLKVLPHNAKMHYNFGNFLRDSAQPEAAITHYHEALRLWPSYSSAHNNIGTILQNAEIAEQHFLAAIRYSSEHLNAHYNLGKLYRKSNKTDQAIGMLNRCVELEPRFVPPYLELAKLYQGVAAGRILERVVTVNPKNADIRVQFGDWLYRNDMLFEALSQYQRALRIANMHQTALTRTCRTLRKLGQSSRLHQLILRWQFMIRRPDSTVPSQSNIYLRDWSIKHELRNRAMRYDNDNLIRDCPSSRCDETDSTSANLVGDREYENLYSTSTKQKTATSPQVQSETIRILRFPHCNRAENMSQTCKKHLDADVVTAAHKRNTNQETRNRLRKYNIAGHRGSGSGSHIDPDDSIVPLFATNILDSL